MTGQEPELRYDDKKVLDKLLADNKVPRYYYEEFYQQIEEFNGLSLETQKEFANHKKGGVFMEEYDSISALANHIQNMNIWTERFRRFKNEKVIEEPLVDRLSMSNLMSKADKEPKQQVDLRDLELRKPYKNGFMQVELLDRPIATQFEDMFFSVQLICQDRAKQNFELKIFNLGCKKEFSQFINHVSCGSTIIVNQPYMTVNKQGYFMIRNDALSNIDYDKNYIVTPQFLYKQAEL